MAYIEQNNEDAGKEVLFEYLSRSCFDRGENDLIGFMILDDGNFFQIKYKLKPNLDSLFPVLEMKNLDKENYKKNFIWNSSVLSNKLKQLINLHQEEINNFPKFIANNLILDGKEDLVRIKDKIISGCNIFYHVPYTIDQNKLKQMEPEQQANEKALELLTLFYNEIQTILLKELNHFNGFSSFCKKCKKQYYISLGEQALSISHDYRMILYLCPNCGQWENKEVHLFEDADLEKCCPKCNEYMIHYEKYNPLAFNKMICPKCNKLLYDKHPGLFN